MDPDKIQTQEGAYWHEQYLREHKVCLAFDRKVRDLEAQVGRQKRTIQALLEEAQNDAQKPVDGPVVNESTPTLEERVNKLERIVADHVLHLETNDASIKTLAQDVRAVEAIVSAPVETKVDINPLIVKGAAMLDLADAINRSINRAGRK